MTRNNRAERQRKLRFERIGHPGDAQRFTVNLSADVAAELRDIADDAIV